MWRVVGYNPRMLVTRQGDDTLVIENRRVWVSIVSAVFWLHCGVLIIGTSLWFATASRASMREGENELETGLVHVVILLMVVTAIGYGIWFLKHALGWISWWSQPVNRPSHIPQGGFDEAIALRISGREERVSRLDVVQMEGRFGERVPGCVVVPDVQDDEPEHIVWRYTRYPLEHEIKAKRTRSVLHWLYFALAGVGALTGAWAVVMTWTTEISTLWAWVISYACLALCLSIAKFDRASEQRKPVLRVRITRAGVWVARTDRNEPFASLHLEDAVCVYMLYNKNSHATLIIIPSFDTLGALGLKRDAVITIVGVDALGTPHHERIRSFVRT
jgi:hypothetical protein